MIPQLELHAGETPGGFKFKETNIPCTLSDIYGGPSPTYDANLTNGFPGAFDEQVTGHGLDFTKYV